MPPTMKSQLISIKRSLIAARALAQDAVGKSARLGHTDLAERLREVVEQLGEELDFVDVEIANSP